MIRPLARMPEAPLRAFLGPVARRGIAWLHSLTGRSARERARLDGTCAAVLMYHRVLPRAEAERLHVEPGMFVTPESFEKHLGWLARYFTVMPLHEIVAHVEAGQALPKGACAITFDDGWRDNLEYALPALERRRLPATIFAVTDRVGTTGAFWPDEICRRLAATTGQDRRKLFRGTGLELADDTTHSVLMALKDMDESQRAGVLEAIRRGTKDPVVVDRELLDWDELDRLAEAGIDIESHAASHAILTRVSREIAAGELARSLAILKRHGHARHALLAYPSGGFDASIVELAREAGYRAAFTTQIGLTSAADDPLSRPRVAVHEDISSTRVEFLRWVPGPARQAGRGAS